MKIVSNATPLIAFSRINELELLRSLFGNIIVPNAVCHEVVTKGAGRPGADEVKKAFWIKKVEVQNVLAVSLLKTDLDQGEAEAIVLAKELNANYLLLDEKKARRIARNSGIKIIGTAGIIGLAAKMNLLFNIDDVFDKLERNGFRFTENIKNKIS